MEYGTQSFLRQKLTIKFSIKYSDEHPIAVYDFTKALDSLNQIYTSYILCQFNSEKNVDLRKKILSHIWEKESIINGKKWEWEFEEHLEDFWQSYMRKKHIPNDKNDARIRKVIFDKKKQWIEDQKRQWAGKRIGRFYIDDIKKGSIIGVISDPHVWFAAIGFIGSLASIISLLMSGQKNENTYNSKNNYRIKGNNNIIINDINIINHTYNIINLIQRADQSIKIEDVSSGESVEIDYNNSIQIRNNSNIICEILYPIYHRGMTRINHVWIQIEKYNYDEYYATIINHPLIQQYRLPLDILDFNLRDKISSVQHLNNYFFMVDIGLSMERPMYDFINNVTNQMRFIVFSYHDYMTADQLSKKLRSLFN